MRPFASLCAGLAVALFLSQARAARSRPRGRADAGAEGGKPFLLGTDPPGRLRPALSATDAGVHAVADAGPDDLHRELQALRSRIDLLERERAAARGESQKLDQLAAEMRALRAQLGEADARKEAAEENRAAQKEQVTGALGGLATAQQRLSEGNASIEDELSQAEATLTGEAKRDVHYAREALRNRDLSQTRAWLSAASRAAAQQAR